MKRTLLALSLTVLLTGCSSLQRNASNLLFPPYPSSDQRQGEVVKLEKKYKTTIEDFNAVCSDRDSKEKSKSSDEKTVMELLTAAPFGGSAALQLAADQVQQMLKEESKRYKASYSAVVVGDQFYNGCKPDSAINLESLSLTRSVSNVDAPVMELDLGIATTLDQTAFQIEPRRILIHQSKAKIAALDFSRPFGFDLLAPWTVFKLNSPSELSPLRPKQVDVEVTVSFAAVWIDDKGPHSETVATRTIRIDNVELGKEKQIGQGARQLFPAIPRSVLDSGKLGLGNFVASVLVTEYDKFAERVQEVEKNVEEHKDDIVSRLSGDL